MEAETSEEEIYAEHLWRLQNAWWKRALHVQAPYRWNLRRLRPGFTLEVGCGIGRNLEHLSGNAVGVDQNRAAVNLARGRGLAAFTATAFATSEYAVAERFDSLLLAHVAEHMHRDVAVALIDSYRPYIRRGGNLILICPQERGFAAEPAAHVEFLDFEALEDICSRVGATVTLKRSFPLPRLLGRLFVYNEFVIHATFAE